MERFKAPYQDRREAGRELGQRLLAYKSRPDVIVLSVSPPGILVADGIAEALEVPLDVFCIRTVGVPGYEGVSMGTVARATCLPKVDVIEHAGLSLQSFLATAAAEQEELDRLEAFYRNGRAALNLAGRTVIVVDEGLTDESGLPEAIEALHRHGVAEIVIAVPVTTADLREKLSKQADEFVSSHTIDTEGGLEIWYEDAAEVDEETVRATLAQAVERLATERKPA